MKKLLLLGALVASYCFGQIAATVTAPISNNTIFSNAYDTWGTATAAVGQTISTGGVVMEIDGTNCVSAGSCTLDAITTGSPVTWTGRINAGALSNSVTHTIQVFVTDSAMNTAMSTTVTGVHAYHWTPACSATLITGSVYCEEAEVAGATGVGPSSSVTMSGPFAAGDTVHALLFLLRPASPFTTSMAGMTATQTSVTVSAPTSFSDTATVTSTASNVVTLTTAGVCSPITRSGQTIVGGGLFAPGTTILNCVNPAGGGNQVTVYPNPVATGTSAVTITYSWPSASSIGAATADGNGSGYAVGDILTVTGGGCSGGGCVGDLEVTSIGAGGSVTGVLPTAKTPDRFFNSTGYTTTASGVATSGGSGTGATVGITAGFVATITDQGWGPGFEKFLVTAATGNNWSGIVRGFAGTQPIAHCQAGSCSGSTGTFNPGPYPLLPSYITDSAGNIWTLLNRSQTEYTDENTVPLADYSMTFTSITAAAANGNATACGTGPCDTITYTMPYSLLSDISLNVARYRGLGAISSLNNPQPTNGYAANDCLVSCPGPGGVTHPTLFNTSMATNAAVPTSTGPGWSGVSSGDICIAFAGGSPFMPVNGENPLIYPQGVTGGTVSVVNGTSTVTYVSGPNFNSSYSPGVTSVVYNMWTPGSSVVIGGTPFHFATTPTSAMGTFTTVETIGLATATYSYSVPNGGSTQNPSAGWKLAVGDQARVLETYAVATGTSCNGGGYVTHGVDGMFTLGAAYHPAGGSTTVYGQSAKIGATGSLSNTSIPALNTSMGKGSVDFEIDNLSTANNATFLSLSNLGFNLLLVQLGGGSYEIGGGNSNLTGGSCQGSPYGFIISNVASVGGNLPVYGRYQVDFSVKTDWFELWDGTGARIYSAFCNWASVTGSTSNGVSLGGLTSPDTMQFGFLWQRSTILPMNSKMPTFAHAGSPNCVYDWHFDTSTGNTTDSCAGTYPLTASGTVSYVNTASTVQSLIKAVPVQFGSQSTSVSGWSTMNSAIGSQQMDCLAQSIIEYNATDVPASCAWTQTQGPTLTGMPVTANQPTISGITATNQSVNTPQFTTLKFSAAVARVKAGTGNAHVLCVGDSICAGYPYNVYSSWFEQISLSGVSLSPGLGVYADAVVGGTPDGRWTLGGDWAYSSTSGVGWGGYSTLFGTTGSIVFSPAAGSSNPPAPPVFDSFKIWYATNTGLGTFTATATGGSGTIINTASGSPGLGSVVINAGAAGTSNMVTIGSLTGGAVYIVAIEGILSTSKLVYLDNAAASGASAQAWSATTYPYSSIPLIEAKAPDLCIIALGNNDAAASTPTATYLTYMQSLINACQLSGDVILQTTWPQQTTAASYPLDVLYHGALLPFAEAQGIPVIDVWGYYKGVFQPALTYSDGIHPNTSGYAAIAGLSNVAIGPQAVGGDYILSLTVTDLESPPVTSGAGTIEMGAAALDANGVVTNITGNAGQFFGPLMSYGNIPWGETDNLHFQMVALQAAYQGAQIGEGIHGWPGNAARKRAG